MSAPLPRAAGYDALALAWASWLLEADQMPLTLPPAPRNNPALASATNAMRSVYSIRSWPCSSYQRFAMWSILGLRPLRTITASMQQLQDIEGVPGATWPVRHDGIPRYDGPPPSGIAPRP